MLYSIPFALLSLSVGSLVSAVPSPTKPRDSLESKEPYIQHPKPNATDNAVGGTGTGSEDAGDSNTGSSDPSGTIISWTSSQNSDLDLKVLIAPRSHHGKIPDKVFRKSLDDASDYINTTTTDPSALVPLFPFFDFKDNATELRLVVKPVPNGGMNDTSINAHTHLAYRDLSTLITALTDTLVTPSLYLAADFQIQNTNAVILAVGAFYSDYHSKGGDHKNGTYSGGHHHHHHNGTADGQDPNTYNYPAAQDPYANSTDLTPPAPPSPNDGDGDVGNGDVYSTPLAQDFVTSTTAVADTPPTATPTGAANGQVVNLGVDQTTGQLD